MQTMENIEYLYRFYDVASPEPIYYEKFAITKKTPKGCWITIYGYKKRFVLTGTRKCFAHSTKEEAFESFKYRKEFQLRILKTRYEKLKELVDNLHTIVMDDIPSSEEYLYFE